VEHLGRLLVSPTNIRLGLNGLQGMQIRKIRPKKVYSTGPRGHIQNTSFSSQLTKAPNKLECFKLESLFSLVKYNNIQNTRIIQASN
jgi:hypothetical protein